MRLSVIATLLAALLSLGAPPSGYQVSKKISLPGAGGWDYLTVDEGARRLYISHATQVVVVDTDRLEVVGSIGGLAGVHGIALAPEFQRGFITSGQTDSVVVFDSRTLARVAEIKTGRKPDAIVYDPATKQVFAMNGDGESATVLRAADNQVVGTVALGGGPEAAVADGRGSVFVNLEDSSELLQIDARSREVKNRWPVAPCQAPSSMAFDEGRNRLFLGCRSRLMAVVDPASGKVVASFPIGDKADASVFDKTGRIAFTSTGDGHIYGFRQDSADAYTPLPVIATAPGSKTMTMDQKTRLLFVPMREENQVSIAVLAP